MYHAVSLQTATLARSMLSVMAADEATPVQIMHVFV